jgi:hypothetical protein
MKGATIFLKTLVVVLLLAPRVGLAQETGAISGTVQDSTGAVLPGVSVAMEIFNVTNANTVQGRITILGSAYQRVTSIMRGRMLRFGLNVKF